MRQETLNASMTKDAACSLAHQMHQSPSFLPAMPCPFLEVTGIPRETVRRKLAKLVDLGWIQKTPEDMYVITDKIGDVFAAFDDSQTYDLMHTPQNR